MFKIFCQFLCACCYIDIRRVQFERGKNFVFVVGKCKNFGTVIAIAGDKFGDSWEIEPESLEPYGDFDKDSIYAKLRNQDIETTAKYFKQLFGCDACAYRHCPSKCNEDDRCAYGFIEFLKGRIA